MIQDEKRSRFLRVAHARMERTLECLQTLGNCSTPSSYAYDEEDLRFIFRQITEKLAEVWHRMTYHSAHSFLQFRLDLRAELEIGGRKCRWNQLMPMAQVVDCLHESGANFTALESIREQYAAQFGNELCWSYPLCTDNHLGYVLLPVQEGILYLPYDNLDSETYEQFDLEAVRLLTADKAQELKEALLSQTAGLYVVLEDAHRALCMTDGSDYDHDSSDEEGG